MEKKYKVSIIVPVYNSEQYVRRCIDSILNQTYSNIELILVNDGSTDKSKEICIDYQNKDNRIKLIDLCNSGPSIARNSGIEAASGHFVQFVDSDDYIAESMTECLVNSMDAGVDIVFTGYKIEKEDSKGTINIKDNNRYKTQVIAKEAFFSRFGDFFKKYYINYAWNKLYRARIIKECGIRFDPSIKWGEDLLFNIEYLGHCNTISILGVSPYHYNAGNANSITSKFNKDLFVHQRSMYDSVKRFLVFNNAYSDENKMIVETKVANAVVLCLNHLFHPDAPYGKDQLRAEVSKIISTSFVQQCLPYMNIGLHRKIMQKLIRLRLISVIIFYLRAKKYLEFK